MIEIMLKILISLLFGIYIYIYIYIYIFQIHVRYEYFPHFILKKFVNNYFVISV